MPRTTRLLRWSAGTVLGGAALILADRAVKRRFGAPPRRAHGTAPPAAHDVAINAVEGHVLRGWWLSAGPGGEGPAALVIHGWGGSAADMLPVADPLLRLGLSVLLLDARGHGRSDDIAVASMPSFADDVRSGLRWLRNRPDVDPTRIVLVGHSVGAGACLFVAADDADVAGVISLASMADPREYMSRQLRRWLPGPLTKLALKYVEHTIGRHFPEFVPVNTVGRIRTPILLLHGARDATVPVADAHRLHALAPDTSTLVVVEDADHFSVEALDPTLIAAFLEEAGLIDAQASQA